MSCSYVFFQGKPAQHFVVEMSVKKWDPFDPRNETVGKCEDIRIQPYYADEEGKVHFRKQASIIQVCRECLC